MPPAPDVHLGVGVFVVRDRKILLLKRRGSHGEGTWAVPGGWIDSGETPEEAAKRELWEETGLHAVILWPRGWSWGFHPDGGFSAATLCFEAHVPDYEKPVNKEPAKASAMRFVGTDELHQYPLFPQLYDWMSRGYLRKLNGLAS